MTRREFLFYNLVNAPRPERPLAEVRADGPPLAKQFHRSFVMALAESFWVQAKTAVAKLKPDLANCELVLTLRRR